MLLPLRLLFQVADLLGQLGDLGLAVEQVVLQSRYFLRVGSQGPVHVIHVVPQTARVFLQFVPDAVQAPHDGTQPATDTFYSGHPVIKVSDLPLQVVGHALAGAQVADDPGFESLQVSLEVQDTPVAEEELGALVVDFLLDGVDLVLDLPLVLIQRGVDVHHGVRVLGDRVLEPGQRLAHGVEVDL